MAQSQVVSLVPAVIDWFDAMGVLSSIIGRTHDWKPTVAAAAIPAVTGYLDGQCALHTGVIRTLAPDVTILSRYYGPCASNFEKTYEALTTVVSPERIHSFDPLTFKQVMDSVLSIARAARLLQPAMSFLARREADLASIQRRFEIGRRRERGAQIRLVCLETVDPPTVAGRWLPDLADLAGAFAALSDDGGPSRPVTWAEIAAVRPEQIVVLEQNPIAYDAAGVVRENMSRQGIDVPMRFVHGDDFLNPGPRLYEAASSLIRALRSEEERPSAISEGSASDGTHSN